MDILTLCPLMLFASRAGHRGRGGGGLKFNPHTSGIMYGNQFCFKEGLSRISFLRRSKDYLSLK